MSESMMLVAAWIVSLGVAVCVGMWIERRRSGALRYGHLAGSDYLYLHGGELTGKWQRVKPSADV